MEHVGPVTIWRKELRSDSGGAGAQRGGLGQVIEMSANRGHHMYLNAMFDRCDHPAQGREGGSPGAPGVVRLDDGSPLKSKGTQWIPADRRLVVELPGGGGYGDPRKRSRQEVETDLARDYIRQDVARSDYGFGDA